MAPTDGRPPNAAPLSSWEKMIRDAIAPFTPDLPAGTDTKSEGAARPRPRLRKIGATDDELPHMENLKIIDENGIIFRRDTSRLWFQRGALAKIRSEQQFIMRGTTDDGGFCFIEKEGVQHGVLEHYEDSESDTEEPAAQEEAKEGEAEQSRTARQDSAAGPVPIDWNNPGIIDFTDVATRRACVKVIQDFFNRNRTLVPQFINWLH
ncbi:hypothetical protein PRZ48_002327 [Zasmidium cellare]|uniref:Uncharacterized protein n=1 Tax=Zasmidium cellare TaxID=395010 RepID=A0ABR0F5W4_ZASCE|nr:hypothetical protein PRZ48_002327 [Zasmidium cellare]